MQKKNPLQRYTGQQLWQTPLRHIRRGTGLKLPSVILFYMTTESSHCTAGENYSCLLFSWLSASDSLPEKHEHTQQVHVCRCLLYQHRKHLILWSLPIKVPIKLNNLQNGKTLLSRTSSASHVGSFRRSHEAVRHRQSVPYPAKNTSTTLAWISCLFNLKSNSTRRPKSAREAIRNKYHSYIHSLEAFSRTNSP